jgi:hypothetical protein
LHQRHPSPLNGDVDVIWYDPLRADPAEDGKHEIALQAVEPAIFWSVKNQARMHLRNDDARYVSATDAMRYWPETATAVGIRRNDEDGCEIAAPFGLDDLLNLMLRPTPGFAAEKHHIYAERLQSKRWKASWPLLKEAER